MTVTETHWALRRNVFISRHERIAVTPRSGQFLIRRWTRIGHHHEAQRALHARIPMAQSETPMWMVDPETFRFASINNAAVKLFGYSREQLSTMSIFAVLAPEDI